MVSKHVEAFALLFLEDPVQPPYGGLDGWTWKPLNPEFTPATATWQTSDNPGSNSTWSSQHGNEDYGKDD